MKYAMAILFAATALAQSDIAKELDRVAQIATVMVDGDLANRIESPRSRAKMLDKNPQDKWAAADNYDVDHASFISMKKTLIRLSKLCPIACDVNLWMPVPDTPPRIHIVIRNVNEWSQFWRWGDLHQPVPDEMRRVLDKGERVEVRRRAGMISVLAPVRDSLGDVAGLVEVVAQLPTSPEARKIPESVK